MGAEMRMGRMVQVFQRKNSFLLLILIISAALLSGCGVELAREPIQSAGHYQLSFEHDSALIDLWTDLDVEYIESTEIWYEIEVSREGEIVAELICNPFDHDSSIMARHTEVRGVTKESFLAPMMCEVNPLPEGNILLDIDLYAEGGSVQIFRADLVVNERE